MLLVYSQKYSYKLINYFKPPQIFPTNYPNIPHIITQLGPSQILPIISHILPNLGSHRYFLYYPTCAFSYHYQKWATKLCHLYKSPNSFTLWAKPKKPNKTLLQSSLLYGTSKTRYYMASLKLVATWQPKVRCYTAFLQSPLLHGNIFTKISNYLQKPNTIFGNY